MNAETPESGLRSTHRELDHSDLLEEVNCTLCGRNDYDVLRPATYPAKLSREALLEVYRSSSDSTLMDRLVRCRSCSMVYLSPRVNTKLILESYSSAIDPRFAAQNPQRIRTFFKAMQSWLKRRNWASGADRSILDVGCAAGAFPAASRELGFQTVGVEPSRWMCKYAQETYGLDVRPGTLEEQSFADGSFDVVTLWDVIEHLSSPEIALGEIRRVLKSDGFLIVNYPDFGSFLTRLMGFRWPFFLSVHLHYFTPRTIRQILAQARFEVIEIQPYFQTLQLGYVLERASQYLAFLKPLTRGIQKTRLGKIPFTYYMGQTLVTARPMSS